MPGVGVAPLGTLLALAGSGIPGVEFDEGAIGLVEKPGGKLFASTVTLPDPAIFEFALTFTLVSVDDPHAATKSAKDKSEIETRILDIKLKTSFIFKIAVPA
jgi:hypothetical protein